MSLRHTARLLIATTTTTTTSPLLLPLLLPYFYYYFYYHYHYHYSITTTTTNTLLPPFRETLPIHSILHIVSYKVGLMLCWYTPWVGHITI